MPELNLVTASANTVVAKCVIGTCITILSVFFGSNLVVLEALFILIIIDFITGIAKTLKKKEKIVSSRMLSTVRKTLLYMMFLIAAHQMTRISPFLSWMETFTASFLAITEMLSIIENLSQAGIIIPKWVVDRLHKYLDTGEFK